MTLPEWSERLCAELGLELEVDLRQVLDLARDAARGVERPAAPLTTFLVGYAAARRGGTPADVTACTDIAAAAASRWAAEHPESGGEEGRGRG